MLDLATTVFVLSGCHVLGKLQSLLSTLATQALQTTTFSTPGAETVLALKIGALLLVLTKMAASRGKKIAASLCVASMAAPHFKVQAIYPGSISARVDALLDSVDMLLVSLQLLSLQLAVRLASDLHRRETERLCFRRLKRELTNKICADT